jgi:UDP-N-acetyl-D-mannosaminuronate dehydrogenase
VPSAEIPLDGLDLIVVCVGTPIDDTGYADVLHVARALDQATPAMAAGAACVIRSTLPVGSAARLANRPRVAHGRLFVAPEFLRQGSALEDIRRPTRVVVGTFGEHVEPDALALVTGALAQPGTPLLVMRAEDASLVKNASNVFLALRLTFANEVAGLAEDVGVDVGRYSRGSDTIPGSGTRTCNRATDSAGAATARRCSPPGWTTASPCISPRRSPSQRGSPAALRAADRRRGRWACGQADRVPGPGVQG